MLRCFLPVAVLALAGCLSGTPGAGTATAEPAESWNGTLSASLVEREGEIIVKAFNPPKVFSWKGDAPFFQLTIPNGTTRVEATLAWTPPHEMQLEFHPPRDGPARTETGRSAPLVLRLEQPEAGTWNVNLGPPNAGGPVKWALTLNVTAPHPPEIDGRQDTTS